MPAISTFVFFAEAAQQPGNPLLQFAPFVIIFVMLYFMMIRPQRRAQREHQLKLAAIKSGDEVVAAGGIHGLVTNVNEKVITLRVADNVKIRVEKASIITILKKSGDPDPEPAPAATDAEAAK